MSSTNDGNADNWRASRKWILPIIIPYLMGILWTCFHPVANVLGGLKSCRGWFIDENALEPAALRSDSKYTTMSRSRTRNTTKTLCEALQSVKTENFFCQIHLEGQFELARLLPRSNAVDPISEAIVLVAPFPATSNWEATQLHWSILELMRRLASPRDSPWLSKTIFLLTPSAQADDLSETVSAFLSAFMGQGTASNLEPLPVSVTSSTIRSLIVLEESLEGNYPRDEFRLLSQGERGQLPNLDLVFLLMSILSRARSSDRRTIGSRTLNDSPKVIMHPFGVRSIQWHLWVSTNVTPSLRQWAEELGDLVLFAYALAVGPSPPHSPALDFGIDAVTVKVVGMSTQASNQLMIDLVSKVEITIRALSNLHERLHHSTTLYALPSPKKMVKHEEYLVPNLLVILPFVIRAASLALHDIQYIHFGIIGWMAVVTLVSVILLDLTMSLIPSPSNSSALFAILYSLSAFVCYWKCIRCPGTASKHTMRGALKCMQLTTCLAGLYTHIPLAFGHGALAYPSALCLAPFVAFPYYATFSQYLRGLCGKVLAFFVIFFLVMTSPPGPLLSVVFPTSSPPYLLFVYTPLHLLVSLCLLAGLLYGVP